MQLGWNCNTRNVECCKIFASKKIFEGHVILKYWITSCCERRRVTHAKTFLKTSSDWNKMTSISGILLKLREKYGYGSTKAKALMSFHSFLCSSRPLCCKLFEWMSCILSLDLPPEGTQMLNLLTYTVAWNPINQQDEKEWVDALWLKHGCLSHHVCGG